MLRLGLTEEWRRQVEAALADGVAVAFADVDGLMELNAQAGRGAGDRAIAAVEAGLEGFRAERPGRAWWCRVQGDEFALALPGASLEEAFLIAEELRRRIAAELAAAGVEGPGVSVGVAQAPRDAGDVEGLLRAAETACYLAKEAGGARVGLPAKDDLVMKSCYYPATAVRRLRLLAERTGRKESELFREGLERLLAAYGAR